MTTFVLVHGAFGGAHGFRQVRPFLQSADGEHNQVFTPSLTGIGERSHLVAPYVGLDLHIQDVVNVIRYEDLTDIVLLGFSYGGMVISGALEHIGDRVRHLVYLDAFVPGDGQSVMDVLGTPRAIGMDDVGGEEPEVIDGGTSWLIPPISRSLDNAATQAWGDARRSHQPMKTLTDSVRMSKPLESWPFGLTFIKATDDPVEGPDSPFWSFAKQAQASGRWTYHEIATNHMIPQTHPAELASILLALPSSAPS